MNDLRGDLGGVVAPVLRELPALHTLLLGHNALTGELACGGNGDGGGMRDVTDRLVALDLQGGWVGGRGGGGGGQGGGG